MANWMSKARARFAGKSRDAPSALSAEAKYQAAWLCSSSAFNVLVDGGGYTRLSSCPEVVMCVHKYADLISSMTIHLMQNTDRGDVRQINGLSRKVDIEPYRLMTRKAWMYNIIQTLMLEGDGNQITYPKYGKEGYLDDLIPWKPSQVSFRGTDDGYVVRYGGIDYTPDELLHFVIRPDSEAPWKGTGYRTSLKDVVTGLKQASATKQALMESPTPSLIVSIDGLTEEFASAEGREKLKKQYLDTVQKAEPWMIPAEMIKVTAVKPLTLNDLAIRDGIELDRRTVAGIFSVPRFSSASARTTRTSTTISSHRA